MQFRIQPVHPAPDFAHVTGALLDADPTAVVDFDHSEAAIRLSTMLGAGDIERVLTDAGLKVDATHIARVPSECCGGCGG